MDDLRALFVKAGEPTIHLQNNAIMPELSSIPYRCYLALVPTVPDTSLGFTCSPSERERDALVRTEVFCLDHLALPRAAKAEFPFTTFCLCCLGMVCLCPILASEAGLRQPANAARVRSHILAHL